MSEYHPAEHVRWWDNPTKYSIEKARRHPITQRDLDDARKSAEAGNYTGPTNVLRLLALIEKQQVEIDQLRERTEVTLNLDDYKDGSGIVRGRVRWSNDPQDITADHGGG